VRQNEVSKFQNSVTEGAAMKKKSQALKEEL
jgi:hypothetical protein